MIDFMTRAMMILISMDIQDFYVTFTLNKQKGKKSS